jgi:hypothetical protein
MENERQYINVSALKDRFKLRVSWLKKDVHDQYSLGLFHGAEYDAALIDEIPVAEVKEVIHGRWERTTDGAAFCTACKRKMNPSQYGYAFCSLCGAKMDLEKTK